MNCRRERCVRGILTICLAVAFVAVAFGLSSTATGEQGKLKKRQAARRKKAGGDLRRGGAKKPIVLRIREDRIEALFNKLDKNSDGSVSLEELKGLRSAVEKGRKRKAGKARADKGGAVEKGRKGRQRKGRKKGQ
jgi:hypothetical protein